MFKILGAIALACLPFSPAFCDPLDDLFVAAQADNSAGVEDLLASADSPKLRRDMMWMLGGSHPDLRAFTKSWAEAEPDNPAALTARAWSRYREGFLVRGTDSVDFSWPASLDEARPIIAEAFDLAERALALDPGYLPASDAVIIIGEVSLHMDRSQEEAQRILEIAPNRHSLVIAASTVRPDWLGRMGVKTELCDAYAEKVTDAPGYTPEMCAIEAIYKGNTCCSDELTWANERLLAYTDEPLMQDVVLQAAAERHLPLEAADRLRARLMSEDRLTVKAAVYGRPDILHLPYETGTDPFTEFEATKAALKRELAAAQVAADRDPGDPKALEDLGYYYQIATSLELRDAGYLQIPPPDDILDRYNVVMDQANLYKADMKGRALTMVRISPRNRDALLFAALTVDDHFKDPLESATWRQGLFTNAVLYANYRYDILGTYVLGTKFDRSSLEQKSKYNRAPTYSDAQLTDAFDCPYVRALRLFDAACKASDVGYEECYRNVGLSREREYSDVESTYVRVQAAGRCTAEREGSIESLRYKEVDLGLE